MLSRLLDALVARRDIPDGLRGWAERSAAGGFSSLGDCLDELERAGTAAAAVTAADPPGLSGIFDDDELDAMERAAPGCPGAGVESPRSSPARWLRSWPGWRSSTRGARRADSCAGHRPGDDALDAGSPRGRPYPSAGPGRWTAPAPSSQAVPASASPAPDANRCDHVDRGSDRDAASGDRGAASGNRDTGRTRRSSQWGDGAPGTRRHHASQPVNHLGLRSQRAHADR